MFDKIRINISNAIRPQQKNSMSLPNQYLRYGDSKVFGVDWSKIDVQDKDLYKGYFYGAISLRANAVARVATEYVRSKKPNSTKDVTHPYLDVISKSPTFSDYKFWHDISTFLDLEGIYYLMVVRGVDTKENVGEAVEFKLLNPYNVRRVLSPDGLEVVGYVEQRKGYTREIPTRMIIPIEELNPFSEDEPYAMTDAVKGDQYTLLTAGDYTRSTLKNNINAPGILSTDIQLDDIEFQNFKARIKNQPKGGPLFSNGGALNWEPMENGLSKAALKDINEIGRESVMAVTGTSKSVMGIEQSGTTRETSRTQRDLFTENQVLPRIQVIIDALNQDYMNNYAPEDKDVVYMYVDNPLTVDHESEIKDTEAKDKGFDLFQKLVNKGYDRKKAAQYVSGDMTLEELGEPKNPPVMPPVPPSDSTPPGGETDNPVSGDTSNDEPVTQTQHVDVGEVVKNEMEKEKQRVVSSSEASLQNAIVNADEQLVASVINKLQKSYNTPTKNAFDEAKDIITKKAITEVTSELDGALQAFYNIILAIEGQSAMRRRRDELEGNGSFIMITEIKKYAKELAGKVSESHVETVLSDLLTTTREAALEGVSRDNLISRIKKQYSGQITEQRAKTVARTETNRAFTRAQYEADLQFVKQNNLEGKVFKKWVTRSDNPCPYCQKLESEGEIPFSNAFRGLGDTVEVDGQELKIGFESLEAGNAHPNCSCSYELVIRQ